MNEKTRVIISQIGNKEYDELSTENRLMIELSILELFCDGRSKTSITLHKGEKKPIGIINKDVVYGCTDKIDVYNELEEKKLLAEFDKLFEAKKKTLKSTAKVIDLDLIELELYNSPAIRKEHIILNMWEEYLTNKKNVTSIAQENITFESVFKDSANAQIVKEIPKTRKYIDKKITFESVFKDSANAQIVKEILKTRKYIDENNKWIGLTNETTELLAAYYVLKPILKQSKISPQATIFYNEFGLSVGKDNTHNGEDITDRSLRIEPFNVNRTEFEKIFASLLPKK